MPKMLTTKAMAAYLRMHEVTILKYAATDTIPAIRIGRVWRYDKDEVDKWIQAGLKQKKGRKRPYPPTRLRLA